MAVTGFWPVKNGLKGVLNYADDPDKSTEKGYPDDDLYAALRYAGNDKKTDLQVYVGGINCSAQNAYQEMIAVQKRFGNRGSIVAYHGIQSFTEGEVTAEEAFEIGKETARKMWGDRYQALVTVHLNTENIHCHFVVNPVSFVDGKKFKNKIGDHLELRKISDEICREHEKSVLENSEFYSKGKKKEYWIHQAGKATHRDRLKEDIDYCIRYSEDFREFEMQLRGLGYEIDPVRLSVKAKGWERAVRLDRLGYSEEYIREQLEEHQSMPYFYREWNAHLPYKARNFPLERELRHMEFSVEHSHDTEEVLIDALFLLLITVIEIVAEAAGVMFLSPDLRDAARDIETFRSDYRFLIENGIHTEKDLETGIKDIREQIGELEKKRAGADNTRRRAHTPEEKQEAKDERRQITKEIKPLREKLKQAEKIREKVPRLYDLLRQEHELERQAQRKLERNR